MSGGLGEAAGDRLRLSSAIMGVQSGMLAIGRVPVWPLSRRRAEDDPE